MHKSAKGIQALDATPHAAEDAIVALVKQSGIDEHGLVTQARAAGMTWPYIFSLMVQFGPQFVAVLQALLAAIQAQPPVAAEAPKVEKKEEAHPLHHKK